MGVSSSSAAKAGVQGEPEGSHFSNIIKPPLKAKDSKAGEGRRVPEKVSVEVHAKARIIKSIEYEKLWDIFLSGPTASFALSPAEASALLSEALQSSSVGSKLTAVELKLEVNAYIELIQELSEADKTKALDFMAICSSVLLLSNLNIETRIDALYTFICLSDSSNSIGFDEFFVALTSFERGLSHAMGKPACSEAFVRAVATQWFSLADPQHRGASDPQTTITSRNFFDFCTNRQTSVRRLLEGLAISEVQTDRPNDLQEIEIPAELEAGAEEDPLLGAVASGGDEFMANPAWKKTAERMIPKGLVVDNSKPSAYLALDWVHGYRGFDCRNNVHYLTASGSQVSFTAAALCIAQV
jgi:hypothetical protein